MQTTVSRTDDFDLDGTGTAAAWAASPWLPLAVIRGPTTYATRAKFAYSATGLYCLFDCDDARLTCTDRADGDDLWTEDVVEAFFWPDESQRLYLEYELSPLGQELPLLVPNLGGAYMGWSPWHYSGERRVRKAIHVRGGPAEPGAAVAGWSAEFFVPFALLTGLRNVPPIPGSRWRANLYRIDHDGGHESWSAWAADVRGQFHDLERFGTLTFD